MSSPRKKAKEIREGKKLSDEEIEALNQFYGGRDPSTMLMFKSRVNQERLKKMAPRTHRSRHGQAYIRSTKPDLVRSV